MSRQRPGSEAAGARKAAPDDFGTLQQRFFALVMDLFWIAVIVGILVEEVLEVEGAAAIGGIAAAVAAAYFAGFTASPMHATPGKHFYKLEVRRVDGTRLDPGRALLRVAATPVSLLAGGLGHAVAAFTARRQALHDLAAGTVVVRYDVRGDPGPAPRTPMAARLGIVVILVLVDAVALAVLTAERVDHQQAVMRTVEAMRPYQAEVERALAERRALPGAGALPAAVRGVAVDASGAIEVEPSDERIAAARIVLIPERDAGGRVAWRCSARNLARGDTPPACRS